MGILDDAIKEHLELKRQHGADQSELKQLEDEAFGAAERPGSEKPTADPASEAPTQFMDRPAPADAEEEAGGRQPRTEIADLQEAPQAGTETEDKPAAPQERAEEEAPAMEHEAVSETQAEPEAQSVPEAAPEPEPAPEPEQSDSSSGHSTQERHAIAEQPTEMFDVEEALADAGAQAPSEEELVEEGMADPRLAPADPLSDLHEAEDEDDAGDSADASLDEEFWDEKRLSDELDQALEAPSAPGDDADPGDAPRPDGEAGAEPAPPPPAPAADTEQHETVPRKDRDEDVLEETPDFLEEAPEDDQLWFEQKPPKDFDFDD